MAAAAAMLRLADEFDNSTTSPPPTFNSTTQPPNIPHGANVPTGFLIAAGCLALIAIGSSLFLIYKHLRNYTEPRFQKPIIRILFMVPIYAINSWLGLLLWKQSIYFDIPRDCYEAYALYQFFTLLVAFLDGERRLIPVLEEKPRLPWPKPLHCLTFKPGLEFYYTARLLILQFVLLKPLLSILSLVLEVFHLYHDGVWSTKYGFLWITIIDNISITISLTYLVLFYVATEEELYPFQPIPKFLAVKIVIFFSFWQGVVISVLSAIGVVHDVGQFKTVNVSAAAQDFLICLEMAAVAIWHHWAFAFEPYRDPTKQPFFKDIRRNAKPLLRNFGDVLNQGDVLLETQRTFHPKEIKQLIASSSRPKSADGFSSYQSSAPTSISNRETYTDVPLSPLNPHESDRAPLLFNPGERTRTTEFGLQQDE